ncbi:HES6.2 family protein [Megaselia abdita]
MNSVKFSKVVKSKLQSERIKKNILKIKMLILEIMQENKEDISHVKNINVLEIAVKHIKQEYEASFTGNFLRGYINATNEVSFALSHLPEIDKSTGNEIIARLENPFTGKPTGTQYSILSPSSSGYGSDFE